MPDWLYQVRLKLSSELSEDLRTNRPSKSANKLRAIATEYNMNIVCTFDAFEAYIRRSIIKRIRMGC